MKEKVVWVGLVIVVCLCQWGYNKGVQGQEKLDTIYVVFSNHLDVGFDGISPQIGYAFNVINEYFRVYFPRAWNTSQYFINNPNQYGDRYTWTTQPFLLWMYLNCHKFLDWQYPAPGKLPNIPLPPALACPSESELESMRKSINTQHGISWHAFPFNAQTEMYDESLFLSQLEVSFSLSSTYGVPKVRTMSQRDVPGVTRAVIPLLRSRGIEALSVGVNGGSAPPMVPRIFRWLDSESGQDLIAMWNPGSYGGIAPMNLVTIPGCPDGFFPAWKGDNAGPHTVEEAQAIFSQLRERYPGTKIKSAIFDDFVDVAKKYKQNLVTIDREIGDTWLYGCSSDPLKIAQYKAALKLRLECIHSGDCKVSDPQMTYFDFTLSKFAEHTWGVDIKLYPNNYIDWTNEQLESVRKTVPFQIAEMSWIEQRSFLLNALTFLNTSGPYMNFRDRIINKWQEISEVTLPNLNGYTKLGNNEPGNWSYNGWSLTTDPVTGAINHLLKGNMVWADSKHMLGYYQYKTYDTEDYKTFFSIYAYNWNSPWEDRDFGKPNVSKIAKPLHASYVATRSQAYYKYENNVLRIWTEMQLPKLTQVYYGAPKSIWVGVELHTDEDRIAFEVKLFEKTLTRLPEAHFFTFNPLVDNQNGYWRVGKLGSEIDPLYIQGNGSFHLHGVDERGVKYRGPNSRIEMKSLDSLVVNPGLSSGYPIPFELPDLNLGWSWHLFNNIWGTNYIMWYPFYKDDSNIKYRFELYFKSQKKL